VFCSNVVGRAKSFAGQSGVSATPNWSDRGVNMTGDGKFEAG
jgi:hypothetical protein